MATHPSGHSPFRSAIPPGSAPRSSPNAGTIATRFGLPPFVAVGDPRSLAAVWDGPIATIDDPREADSAFDVGLPLLPIAVGRQPTFPASPSVAGAHCSLDALELAVGLARSGSAAAVVTGPVSKEQLYAHRLRPSRPDRVRRRALRRLARQCRDDARRADACGRCRSPPTCRLPRSPARLIAGADRGARPGGAARAPAQLRHRRAAPRGRRAQPPCRRRRHARPRGDRPDHAGDRGAARRGLAT